MRDLRGSQKLDETERQRDREKERKEEMESIPVKPLGSTGKAMPLVGMGTAAFPFHPSETMKDSILHAIKIGYRHFDTAAAYNSEKPLGEVIKQALQLGLIKSRDELFITSKLWGNDSHPNRVLPALQQTLQNLELEYLDLYLIHWPVSMKPGNLEVPIRKEDLLPLDYGSVWKQMEDCQKLGLTKAIGVSNFSIKKLGDLLGIAEIPPAVNQVEMNPLWRQKKLREFCEEKGIHITAYSPLGARGTPWGGDRVMECQVLKDIAQARGKSIAQVCLRWIYEQGVSVIVKSFSKQRIKENIAIIDWELSVEDIQKIDQIQQFKGVLGLEFVSDEGPYKSVAELWDEDIHF